MKILTTMDVSAAHERMFGRKLSIYALLAEPDGTMLVGCGLWDRERMLHTNAVKDVTPGLVLRIDLATRNIIGVGRPLANIVYPVVRAPLKGVFVGCRTGAMYLLDDQLGAHRIGSFGGGVYGVAHLPQLDRFFIGGRDGTLGMFGPDFLPERVTRVSDDRVWNLCPDPDGRHLWASSYNGRLFKINAAEGSVTWQADLAAGVVTLIANLSNGLRAVGCMGRSVKLFHDTELVRSIPVPSPVCFVMDLPTSNRLLATGYRGELWVFDRDGAMTDSFVLDTRENNPVWIVQPFGDGDRVAAGWANGVVRVLDLS